MRWMEANVVLAKLFCERWVVVGVNARPFLFEGFFFEAIGINDEYSNNRRGQRLLVCKLARVSIPKNAFVIGEAIVMACWWAGYISVRRRDQPVLHSYYVA